MKHLLAARRLGGRFGALVGTLVLIVLVGGLVAGLVLVRAAGNRTSNAAAAAPGLYVGSRDGLVYKLDTQTGKLRWSQKVGDSVTGLSVVNGAVYASSLNGKGRSIAALYASTGTPIWSGQIESKIASAPALANGVVCITSFQRDIYAFASSNGRLLWHRTGSAFTQVAAFGDLVFSAETDQNSTGTLAAFDARSGAVRWRVSAPSPGWGFSAPVAEHGVVYAMLFAAQQGGYEYALNASDGAQLWRSPLLKLNGAYNPPGAPLVVGGSLYLPTTDGSLIALDTRTGQPLWTYTPASGASATNYGGFSPLWSDGQVVYIGEIGHITLLNASDGTVIRRQDILNYRGSAFIVSGNILFVNSADGVVHALKLADGAQVWQYTYFQPHQETGFDAAAIVLAA